MNNTTYISILTLSGLPLILISFLWDLVFFFIGVGLIYFFLVFIVKQKRSKKERTAIVLKKDIAPIVSTLIFHEDAATRKEKEDFVQAKVLLQQMLKNPANRKMVSEILMDLQADLSGEARQRLIKIYQHYGLHHDAIKRLKSIRWEVVCRGINELTQMQVNGAYIYIRKFINDNRSIVRKQAQVATVALKHEGINYFLDTATCKISEWQQLKLLETLQSLDNYKPPHFRLWLTSKNKFVVLFALRLIKSFEQDDAMDSILKLVKHRDDSIKVEAINCLRAFEIREALPLFKAVFWICQPEVKLALLAAIGHLGTKDEIPFLKEVEQREKEHLIKSKAIGMINALAPETILPSNEIIELLDYPGALPTPSEESISVDAPKAVNLNDIQEQFEEVLKSPDFQKYDQNGHQENFALDLITSSELQDLPVVAQEIKVNMEEPHFEIDKTMGLEDSNAAFHSLLKASAEQIKVKTKKLKNPKAHQADEDYIDIAKFAREKDAVDKLLDFAALSELPDQSNYEFRDAKENGDAQENEIFTIHVIYNEVTDVPDTSDFLEPNFELEWSEQNEDLSIQDLVSGTLDFSMDIYPESFKKEMRSLDQIFSDSIHASEKQDTYISAFELYYEASDMEEKLLLLDEISRYGDERDILFMRKLQDDKSAKIRQSADRNIEILTQRLYPQENAETTELPLYDSNPWLVPEFAIDAEYEMKQGDKEDWIN
ncbi:MAG: hypothetical protein KJO04_04450 [Bacteroidia bacterium]|nr:hypothetical protein [Bacteroidia bacterium]